MAVTVALLALIVTGWAAVAVYWCRALHRRRQRREEWEATAAGLRDLEAELDQVWAAEHLRRRR